MFNDTRRLIDCRLRLDLKREKDIVGVVNAAPSTVCCRSALEFDRAADLCRAEQCCAGTSSMSARPSISVVMPVYNAERYVAEALRSILGQELSDFELIVFDDG